MSETTTPKKDMRLAALRRFAAAITALTIVGHSFLGFEQSYAYVFVALLTGYSVELLLETLEAWIHQRTPYYRGGFGALVNFLLPAHISSLAVAMLLYSNAQLWPIAFATSIAVGSKYIFRVMTSRGAKHFLNPSNTGIAMTLILFPWIGIAPPYQFAENISGIWDWALPLLFIVVGTFLNARFTGRIPLIAAWLIGFALQALLRSWYFGTPLAAALNPMIGVAFLLFTFYMISDPGTTPFKPKAQILFGASVAAVYGFFMVFHVVFTLFFALFTVCIARGIYMYLMAFRLSENPQIAKTESVPLAKEATS